MPDSFSLPAGYGFRVLGKPELIERVSMNPLAPSLMNALLIFEPPRTLRVAREYRYILGVDVADGIGLDRSVCTVARVGTIEEPPEEVAQYVTDSISPSQFAFIVDAIGHLYKGLDDLEAMAVIECNNHGLSVQDTLQLHLGYGHFYRWEYYNSADPGKRASSKIGWVTTPSTRPLLLDKFFSAVTTLDPVTGKPDYIVNSPWTMDELPHFQTETDLGEAEAGPDAHDDCIMANAIANYAAWRAQAGEVEPLEARRRRRHEEAAAREADSAKKNDRRDYRNTPVTADEMSALLMGGDDDFDEGILYG